MAELEGRILAVEKQLGMYAELPFQTMRKQNQLPEMSPFVTAELLLMTVFALIVCFVFF